jgi:hypothetical protein
MGEKEKERADGAAAEVATAAGRAAVAKTANAYSAHNAQSKIAEAVPSIVGSLVE